ncbi:MAG: hypothetical protein PF636_01945 [Actinomycetota bacterium]|jgi:hypothetical protein|nr:hypothetical protein [Actinomycetota bacterium]
MSEDRKRILDMLAEGKITAAEADTLLGALGAPADGPSPSSGTKTAVTGPPKFLYVKVTGEDTVDVKVPLGLLRAGLKLTSLIPPQAMDQINESMSESGMTLDLNNLKAEDIEGIIENLREMEVNVNSKNGDKVRVWCD